MNRPQLIEWLDETARWLHHRSRLVEETSVEVPRAVRDMVFQGAAGDRVRSSTRTIGTSLRSVAEELAELSAICREECQRLTAVQSRADALARLDLNGPIADPRLLRERRALAADARAWEESVAPATRVPAAVRVQIPEPDEPVDASDRSLPWRPDLTRPRPGVHRDRIVMNLDSIARSANRLSVASNACRTHQTVIDRRAGALPPNLRRPIALRLEEGRRSCSLVLERCSRRLQRQATFLRTRSSTPGLVDGRYVVHLPPTWGGVARRRLADPKRVRARMNAHLRKVEKRAAAADWAMTRLVRRLPVVYGALPANWWKPIGYTKSIPPRPVWGRLPPHLLAVVALLGGVAAATTTKPPVIGGATPLGSTGGGTDDGDEVDEVGGGSGDDAGDGGGAGGGDGGDDGGEDAGGDGGGDDGGSDATGPGGDGSGSGGGDADDTTGSGGDGSGSGGDAGDGGGAGGGDGGEDAGDGGSGGDGASGGDDDAPSTPGSGGDDTPGSGGDGSGDTPGSGDGSGDGSGGDGSGSGGEGTGDGGTGGGDEGDDDVVPGDGSTGGGSDDGAGGGGGAGGADDPGSSGGDGSGGDGPGDTTGSGDGSGDPTDGGGDPTDAGGGDDQLVRGSLTAEELAASGAGGGLGADEGAVGGAVGGGGGGGGDIGGAVGGAAGGELPPLDDGGAGEVAADPAAEADGGRGSWRESGGTGRGRGADGSGRPDGGPAITGRQVAAGGAAVGVMAGGGLAASRKRAKERVLDWATYLARQGDDDDGAPSGAGGREG